MGVLVRRQPMDLLRGGNRRRLSYEKILAEGGEPITVRTDNALGCAIARDGSSLYYAVPLANVNGVSDFEIRVARPEDGPSQLLARIPGWRIPAGQTIHPLISPDGKWLALLLSDGAGANIWGCQPRAGRCAGLQTSASAARL